MKPKDRQGSKPLLDDLLKIDNVLPPIDHDETKEPSPEELAALLTPLDETEVPLDFNEGTDRGKDPLEYDLITDSEESSWIEEVGEADPWETDISMDEAENDWAEEAESSALDLDNDWFVDENDCEQADDDGGMAGPIGKEANEFEIDQKSWAELDDNPDEDLEDALHASEFLAIDLPPVESDTDVEAVFGLVLDRQFLGPRGGGVHAAAFIGGSPVGVGDGLFVLGADGMLHPVMEAQILAEMQATSMCTDRDAIFIGTSGGGVLITRNRGKSLKQINGWYAQGLQSGDQTSFERVSTSFTILGHQVPYGYRLIGKTGNGQLFVSFDYGRIWRGLVIPGHCLVLSAVSGSADMIAFIDSKDRGVGLFRNRDLEAWERVNLPEELAASAARGAVYMAAGGETVVVAADDASTSLFCSLDGGRTWMPVNGVKGVTAVIIDPQDPGWIAAAVYNAARDLGLLRTSEDGGQTWQTVFSIGDSDEEDGIMPLGEAETGNRILSLAVNAGREREVIAVTARGVHMVVLARRGVSH
jgi:hypothetical protein